MSSEICIVTTYKRDELLDLCLEAIDANDDNVDLLVCSDRGYESDDLRDVCVRRAANLIIQQSTTGYGNSYNVLTSMELVVKAGHPVIHMVEDDTIIHPGWFDWARIALKRPHVCAVLARIPGDPQGTWYTSPCVSWNAAHLRLCLGLVPPGYLEATTREEMQKILDNYAPFKKSKYRFGSAEQDGFFLRCIEYFGWKTTFPEKCLASHMGWWGYNRDGHQAPEGTFEERIAFCRRALHDREFRTRMFGKRVTDEEMGGMNK